jgi:hypothetical protein
MRSIVFYAAMLLLISNYFCQQKDSIPKIIFGFNIGMNYANTQVKNYTVGHLETVNTPGFEIGTLMDWRIKNRLSLVTRSELSFNGSQISLSKDPDEQPVYQVYPVLIDFATQLNYRFTHTKNAPYILVGPSYKVPLTGDKNIRYATMRNCLSLDFGFGFDKKLKYFNIAPELRYSMGLTDLSNNQMLGNIYFNTISLVVNFKG